MSHSYICKGFKMEEKNSEIFGRENSIVDTLEANRFVEKIRVSSEVDMLADKMKEDIRSEVDRKINRNIRRLFWVKSISIAASILFLMGTFTTYFYFGGLFSGKKDLIKLEAAKGERPHFILPDGTEVTLNSGSKLMYPSKFKKTRTVTLTGEAFFDVTHDAKLPFIVQSEQVKVLVYGTKFNVQSYKEHNNIEVTLLEGSVSVSAESFPEDIHLNPGQRAVYSKNNHQIIKKDINAELYTSWMHGDFYFDQKTFEEIAVVLGQRFNKEIRITSDRLKKMKFTGEFKSTESLEEILHIITFDQRIECTVNNDIVYIRERE